jgi:hypothetical protein
MFRHLQKRLDRLEEALQSRTRGPIRLRYIARVDAFKPVTLAANERIVCDTYLICDGGLVEWARERITSDPSDEGRRDPLGYCLEDIMKEKGLNCERQPGGTCRRCVANSPALEA